MMRFKEMPITPEQATKWLEGNVHNRALRDSTVMRYARDMKAGKWLLTHQAIAFNDEGVLIDGQHRLFAVIEAGVTVSMMVAWGVVDEAQAVIDGGLVRSAVDQIKLGHNYEGATNTHVAIVKRLARHSVRGALTSAEVFTLLKTHKAALDFTVSAFTRRVRGITITPVMAVVTRAFYTQNHERLETFCARLCDGQVGDDEQPILLLRNYLLERPVTRAKVATSSDEVIYGKTARALTAYLHGERLSTLYAANSELFPLPAEKSVTLTGKATSRRKAS